MTSYDLSLLNQFYYKASKKLASSFKNKALFQEMSVQCLYKFVIVIVVIIL